jgi:hypothetical protein
VQSAIPDDKLAVPAFPREGPIEEKELSKVSDDLETPTFLRRK